MCRRLNERLSKPMAVKERVAGSEAKIGFRKRPRALFEPVWLGTSDSRLVLEVSPDGRRLPATETKQS